MARARVPGLEFIRSEGVGLGRVSGCGWGSSRLREGLCSVLWEEALWNHLLFLLLTPAFGNQGGCPVHS